MSDGLRPLADLVGELFRAGQLPAPTGSQTMHLTERVVTIGQLVNAAVALRSQHGENAEYDRALVELVAVAGGVGVEGEADVAALLKVTAAGGRGPVPGRERPDSRRLGTGVGALLADFTRAGGSRDVANLVLQQLAGVPDDAEGLLHWKHTALGLVHLALAVGERELNGGRALTDAEVYNHAFVSEFVLAYLNARHDVIAAMAFAGKVKAYRSLAESRGLKLD